MKALNTILLAWFLLISDCTAPLMPAPKPLPSPSSSPSVLLIPKKIAPVSDWQVPESKIKSSAVQLLGDKGFCSGVQVQAKSGKKYILSAAHCLEISSSKSVKVKTKNGKVFKSRILKEDSKSDLLIVRGVPHVSPLPIADFTVDGEKVRTFTHGGGFKTYKTEGLIIQEFRVDMPLYPVFSEKDRKMCLRQEKHRVEMILFGPFCVASMKETMTTALVIPGSSGGPVVNNDGHLIGIVSISYRGVFSGLVTMRDMHRFLKGF